jgi:hypothetical protein
VTAGVIDQNPAHDLRGHPQEMRPILPIDLALVDDAQIHLMNQSGRLQGVADSLHPKLARLDAAELRIDDWQQLIERSAVAATPISEERRDVV